MRYDQAQAEEMEIKQGFDLVVHHRDEKTGLVMRRAPYILRVIAADGGGKSRVWERPAGSGNLFDKHNQPIGRWDKTKPEGKRFLAGETHIAWTPPETEDQKLARSLIEKETKITELEKELAAIKLEGAKKAPPTQQLKKDQGA